MQLNKVLKGLLIALPVMAVTACSSSDDAASNTGAATNNNGAVETTVATPIDQSGQLTEQELKEQALRETQTIYFAFDNSTIAADYEEMLAAHASYLSKNPALNVTIEGHADERGTPEYNIALGERRAKSVAQFLKVNGASDSQIEIVSYGEEQPAVMGSNEQSWSQNRRVFVEYK